MLRAMFLPGKVTPEQKAFYVDLFKKVTQTAEYKDYMEKQALKPIFLTGKDMLKFLEEDDTLNKSLMTEAGFVAQAEWPDAVRDGSSTPRDHRRRSPALAASISSSRSCCWRSPRVLAVDNWRTGMSLGRATARRPAISRSICR